MKKEAIIFVFIAVAVGGYLLMRSSGDDAAAGDAPKAEVEKTEAKAAADDVILPVGSSYAQGSDKALVTIIEFSEFQCPFCARVLPTMNKIKETYGDKVRIVFKHNPLPFHKDAPLASEAALAAGEQGKFWEMHDKLFENQKKLKRADIDGYAQEIGLDMAKFKADLDSGK
ncbi:MAG: DsbA family protein, partial [Planctomycetota bacterium]